MGRAPCCDERLALKKGPWTPDEDEKLVAYIQEYGHGNWRALPEKAGLARCGKSCRLRWTNYLRPDIKRGRFSSDEDQMIIQLHAILGNRWSAIASHLPRRTDNEIKNYWNTHLKKRLALLGIDPITHQTSITSHHLLALSPEWTPLASARLTHLTQWQTALAEAEARLSKTRAPSHILQASAPHPSAFFMHSWKTKVEDTLRPTFGTVNVTKCSSTPSWDFTALGLQGEPEVSVSKLYNSSASVVKNVAPFASRQLDEFDPPQSENLGSRFEAKPDMFDDLPSRCSGFSDYNYHVENVYDSSTGNNNSEGVAFENHFSPTSILQGPDNYSDSSSASGSYNNNNNNNYSESCFAFQSSYPESFPLIAGEPVDHVDESATMSDDMIPETFWQAAGSLEDAATNSEAGGLELMASLDFNGGGDHIEFPPFESSLCHGAQ